MSPAQGAARAVSPAQGAARARAVGVVVALAGDALVAGLAAALEREASLVDAARAGVASGAASVEVATAGELDPHRATALLPWVQPEGGAVPRGPRGSALDSSGTPL